MVKNLIVTAILIFSQSALSFDSVTWNHDKVGTESFASADLGDILGGLALLYLLDKALEDDDKSHKHHKKPVKRPKRVRIPLGDTLIPRQGTVYLRHELKQRGVDLRNRRLKKVILFAKSKMGRGLATLQLGQNFRPSKRVRQSRLGLPFMNNRRESYNVMEWNANARSNKLWQIHLDGRIKMKSVVVVLD